MKIQYPTRPCCFYLHLISAYMSNLLACLMYELVLAGSLAARLSKTVLYSEAGKLPRA